MVTVFSESTLFNSRLTSSSGRALTILLFVLPFSVGTSATVWLGLNAPKRWISRMTLERVGLVDRAEQEHETELEAVSQSRAEFETIAREIQSYNRIEAALSAVTEKSTDDVEWADRVEAVRRDVDVAFAGTTGDAGYAFVVRMRAADPDFGPRFLRTLGEQFLEKVNQRKRGARDRQEKRLSTRAEALRREIGAIETRLAAAREGASTIGTGAGDGAAGTAEALDVADLEREYDAKKQFYQQILDDQSHLAEDDRKASESAPPFRISEWPSEHGEEAGRRMPGVALLAAAVGSVLGLLGALGSMFFESARPARARF
jgi:hypothetical protein